MLLAPEFLAGLIAITASLMAAITRFRRNNLSRLSAKCGGVSDSINPWPKNLRRCRQFNGKEYLLVPDAATIAIGN